MEGIAVIKQKIIEAPPEIQGEMLDLFNFQIDKHFGSNEALKNTNTADLITTDTGPWGVLGDVLS